MYSQYISRKHSKDPNLETKPIQIYIFKMKIPENKTLNHP